MPHGQLKTNPQFKAHLIVWLCLCDKYGRAAKSISIYIKMMIYSAISSNA